MAVARFPYCVGTNTPNPDTPTLERPLPFQLGSVAIGADNSQWIYGQASEAVTGTCTVNTSTFAITDAAGNHTAPAAIASGQGAWVYLTAGFHT